MRDRRLAGSTRRWTTDPPGSSRGRFFRVRERPVFTGLNDCSGSVADDCGGDEAAH